MTFDENFFVIVLNTDKVDRVIEGVIKRYTQSKHLILNRVAILIYDRDRSSVEIYNDLLKENGVSGVVIRITSFGYGTDPELSNRIAVFMKHILDENNNP